MLSCHPKHRDEPTNSHGGQGQPQQPHSGIRERIGGIGDSDDDGERHEKAREELDDLEDEIDENIDKGKNKTEEIIKKAREKIDDLEKRVLD
jgi:hypothetical protein